MSVILTLDLVAIVRNMDVSQCIGEGKKKIRYDLSSLQLMMSIIGLSL
jgi:hypothetical protein